MCYECRKQLAKKKLKALWCEEEQAFFCKKCGAVKEGLTLKKVGRMG